MFQPLVSGIIPFLQHRDVPQSAAARLCSAQPPRRAPPEAWRDVRGDGAELDHGGDFPSREAFARLS
jgi:hypothetical protein